jgi:hypothetical protein
MIEKGGNSIYIRVHNGNRIFRKQRNTLRESSTYSRRVADVYEIDGGGDLARGKFIFLGNQGGQMNDRAGNL